jgi:hypothetical protein
MEAIDWIKRDLARPQTISPRTRFMLFLFFVIFPVALGILLRESMEGVFHAVVLIPNLTAFLLLSLVYYRVQQKNFCEKQSFTLALWLLPLALLFATSRIFLPDGLRTETVLPGLFEKETFQCFVTGAFTTLVSGIYLSIATAFSASVLNRRARFFLAMVSGISGTLMLGFHCDNSSVAHILWGHVLQGIMAGFLIFGLQEVLFAIRLRKAFPALFAKLNQPDQLGK